MRHAGPAGHEPADLVVREVDGVGQDRPRAQRIGPLVDLEIVAGAGKEPRHHGDLGAVLREVRLPVRAVAAGQGSGLPEHLRAAAHGESRA